jgi:hypothetical protein
MSNIWDMKSDAQMSPESKDELEEALTQISSSNLYILRLCENKLGTFIEIAYEWSWDEVMSMIEILDIREEKRRRAEAQIKAENLATR